MQVIKSLSDLDIGQSIIAAMREGRNLEKLSRAGIVTDNVKSSKIK